MRLPDILNRIVETRSQRLQEEKIDHPLEKLLGEVSEMPAAPSFHKAMAKEGISIIGEIKKASPSLGVIREDFNPEALACEYEHHVDAISVLTEQDFFIGHPDYLKRVHRCVNLPLLRKDFIIDPYQIYEARALGASAILLIAAVLKDGRLKEFQDIAGMLGMDCLVEIHDEKELQEALDSKAGIIGINNRNLHTFEVSLAVTAALSKSVPDNVLIISESGIHSGDDIRTIGRRIDGILAGEVFMRAESIERKAKEFKKAYDT